MGSTPAPGVVAGALAGHSAWYDLTRLVVFDAATIGDVATYDKPHQLARGADAVFVNGVLTVSGGAHTGAKAGRVVRGPGWRGGKAE